MMVGDGVGGGPNEFPFGGTFTLRLVLFWRKAGHRAGSAPSEPRAQSFLFFEGRFMER